jgi:hypothetical protein
MEEKERRSKPARAPSRNQKAIQSLFTAEHFDVGAEVESNPVDQKRKFDRL